MDERFPNYVRYIVRKLDFLGLPNLGMLIAGLAVLAFLAKMGMGTPLERFTFDPELVRQGEWWRLFAFPTGLDNPIWLLFYVFYVFYVINALEEAWGNGPVTIFIAFSYLCAVAAAFLANMPTSIWYYVLENVSLAFGTVFPDVSFYLFMILPCKAKWLAFLAAGILLIQFILGDGPTKLFLVVALLPYLSWFGPMLVGNIRAKRQISHNRKRFDSDSWK